MLPDLATNACFVFIMAETDEAGFYVLRLLPGCQIFYDFSYSSNRIERTCRDMDDMRKY